MQINQKTTRWFGKIRTKAVLIEADGPVFSAGADLTSQTFQGELYPTLEALFAKIARLPVPKTSPRQFGVEFRREKS